MSFGYVLGLPILDLFAGVNLQTDIVRRQLKHTCMRYTIAEKMSLLDMHKKIGKHLRDVCGVDHVAAGVGEGDQTGKIQDTHLDVNI